MKHLKCQEIYTSYKFPVRMARIQVSDGGRYTCVASNRAGVDNKHYNLQVHGESENLLRQQEIASDRMF